MKKYTPNLTVVVTRMHVWPKFTLWFFCSICFISKSISYIILKLKKKLEKRFKGIFGISNHCSMRECRPSVTKSDFSGQNDIQLLCKNLVFRWEQQIKNFKNTPQNEYTPYRLDLGLRWQSFRPRIRMCLTA